MDNFLNIPDSNLDSNLSLSSNPSDELTIQINTGEPKEEPPKTIHVELTGGASVDTD